MTQLVKYDEMCRAIAVAHSVDEVKEIHDKATALEAYMRLSRDVENEKRCAEIRLRSQRRLGELLHETEKGKAGKPKANCSPRGNNSSAFQAATRAAGISPKQAATFQKLARVPEEQFEAALGGDSKPTTKGIIRQHLDTIKPPKVPAPTNEEALRFWGETEDFEKMLKEVQPKVAARGMTNLMLKETIKSLKPLTALIAVALETFENEQDKRKNVASA
jgi:hypothetical protein